MACWKIHRLLNLLMILLLKLPLIGDFPAGHGWWPDRIFLIQWTTLDQGLARSARASDANSSSGNRWVGPPAFARNPRCGGGCGCWWRTGRHLPRNTSSLQWIWSGGLGPWALNFKRIRNIFHSLALWSVLTLGINRYLNHYPPPVRACHGRAMVLETAGCFLTGTVSFLDSQPLLSRGIFFSFECLCYFPWSCWQKPSHF
jgi:hypothetical protein